MSIEAMKQALEALEFAGDLIMVTYGQGDNFGT